MNHLHDRSRFLSAFASAKAIALPMPREAPVTNAIRLFSSDIPTKLSQQDRKGHNDFFKQEALTTTADGPALARPTAWQAANEQPIQTQPQINADVRRL